MIHLTPVLLAEGTRPYRTAVTKRIELGDSNPVADLRYRVVRPGE